MSLIEATIRVNSGANQCDLVVEYGAGKTRVPRECHSIHHIVNPYIAQAALRALMHNLNRSMPDVVIRVIYESNISDYSDLMNLPPPKLVRSVHIH